MAQFMFLISGTNHMFVLCLITNEDSILPETWKIALDVSDIAHDYNMTVWIWAGNYISFTVAAGLIRLHMPGVKKSRV